MKRFLATIAIFLIFYTSLYAQNMFWVGFLFGPISITATWFMGYEGLPLTTQLTEELSEASGYDGYSALANTKLFVQINMDFLRSDIATGSGDTIDALAVLMEVEDAPAFGKRLQANFDLIYPRYDVDYVYVANAIASFASQGS